MFGQAAQVGDIERPVVGRAIVAHQAGAIHGEDDVQALEAHVMDDLVVGALQEGRVDGHDGLDALECQPRGEQDGLLLGDADVEIAVRHGLLQDAQAGARVHGGGDPDDPLIPFAFPHQRLAEDLRVLRRAGLGGCLARLADGRPGR